MRRTHSIFAAACFLLLMALPNTTKAQRHTLYDETAIMPDLKYGRMSFKTFLKLHKNAYCNDEIFIPDDGKDIDQKRFPNQSPSHLKGSDAFICCLDDFGPVLGASKFKVIRNNVYALYFVFMFQSLSSVGYSLNTPSVSSVIPEFK